MDHITCLFYHAIYLDLLFLDPLISTDQLHCSHLCLGCFGMFRAKWRGWQEMIGGKKSIAVQWMDVVRKVKLRHSWHQIIEDDETNLAKFRVFDWLMNSWHNNSGMTKVSKKYPFSPSPYWHLAGGQSIPAQDVAIVASNEYTSDESWIATHEICLAPPPNCADAYSQRSFIIFQGHFVESYL